MKQLFSCLAISSICSAPLFAQVPVATQAQYDSGYYAWADGNYPAALARFERLLSGKDREQFLEPIALLTGELYRTTSVVPNGSQVRWSPKANIAAIELSRVGPTQIVDLSGESARMIALVQASNVLLSPDGKYAAYLAAHETPELRAARALADSLQRAGDRRRLDQQRWEIDRLGSDTRRVVLRDLTTGAERDLTAPDSLKSGLIFSPDSRTLFFALSMRAQSATVPADSARSDIYAVDVVNGAAARAVVEGPGVKQPFVLTSAGFFVYGLGPNIVIKNTNTGETQTVKGSYPVASANGAVITWAARTGGGSVPAENTILALTLGKDSTPTVVERSTAPLYAATPSPDGRSIAYMTKLRDDYDVYVVSVDGKTKTRVTREIQHDGGPQWVDANRLIAIKGEGRHQRSSLYTWNSETGTWEERRLHHNNTIRTVAPEYGWAVSADATKVLIISDRDGDTISPDRGVYLMHLDQRVTTADVLQRVRAMASSERELRARGAKMFAPIHASVAAAVRDVSRTRIFEYERTLYEFDSKYVGKPGNRKAIDYIVRKLREFGYEPELQWFDPDSGVHTANIVATLKGTTNPSIVYVASSHFDSVERGPGADDNTSGTSALLEAARIMAKKPQAATIQFAWFTGEEAGLWGSEEFVKRAVADSVHLAGALNNDMIGWANDARLDNTIRYSNDGIRDLQHAAAFLFTNLITYDSRYYQNTDAHEYYKKYGDIVGGIGSYPILGSPHYHQTHDVLEIINHQLVAEVSKTTVASLMMLASSPARLKELQVTTTGTGATAQWKAAAERGVHQYVIAYGPPSNPTQQKLTVSGLKAVLPGAKAGWAVAVKAINANGMESWDWARTIVATR